MIQRGTKFKGWMKGCVALSNGSHSTWIAMIQRGTKFKG